MARASAACSSRRSGLGPSSGMSVDDDPLAVWLALDGALQRALDDPDLATRELAVGGERYPLAEAVDRFGTPDVLVHTWDLARACGLDETLDPDEVHQVLVAMRPADAAMRASGHYGPAVEVPSDADEQTRLLAFTGRPVATAP